MVGHLCSVAVRLVSSVMLGRHRTQWNRGATVMCALVAVRAGDTLIGVGSFFGNSPASTTAVVIRRTAGAAADTEKPKYAACDGEHYGEPKENEHVFAHACVDVEMLHTSFDGADQDSVQNTSSDRSGNGKQRGNLEQVSAVQII